MKEVPRQQDPALVQRQRCCAIADAIHGPRMRATCAVGEFHCVPDDHEPRVPEQHAHPGPSGIESAGGEPRARIPFDRLDFRAIQQDSDASGGRDEKLRALSRQFQVFVDAVQAVA